MREDRHCGQRVGHGDHTWEEKVTRAPGALTGVDYTRYWHCPGTSLLTRRDHAHPSYLVVTATDTIPAGAQVRVDTATGTASLHYQPEATDQ